MEDSEQRKSNSAPLLATTACVLLLVGIFGVAYESNKSAQAPSAPGYICVYVYVCVYMYVCVYTTHTHTH